MWLSENATSSQASDHIHLSIARGSCRQRVLDVTFPLGACDPGSVPYEVIKGEVFLFQSDGDVSMFGDCNHRWVVMIHSHSAAYEQAQLEADSEDVSQELSHLV